MNLMKNRGQKLVRTLIILLLLVVVVPLNAVVYAGWEELEEHWAETYAEELIDRGILKLDAGERYLPDAPVDRGDLIKWIAEAWGGGQGDPIAQFSSYGILEDLEESDTITRNETAKLAIRSLSELFGEEEEGDDYLAVMQLEDYAACHSCRSFTSQSYVRGLMIGRVPNLFDGEAVLTRAEAWTVVARMLEPELRIVPQPDSDGPVLLTAEAARRVLDAEDDAIILDVRNEDELIDGYIPGSILIPLAELIETEASGLPSEKTTPIIVYCKSGGRSAQAREYLEELGYTVVYDLGAVGNWTFELEY